MKLLVTGKAGQVVQSLQERAGPDFSVAMAARPEFDLGNPDAISALLDRERPDLVVSAAAYTAVDKAESEPELAHQVNAVGAGIVAAAAAKAGIPIIHLSTDYVYPGNKAQPYVESDPTGPLSVYGKTKLEGEQRVASANPQHVILRTAWVYSPFGNNFVRTMLRLAATRDTLGIVSDQFGNPTSALDIADAILSIAARVQRPDEAHYGVFHVAGSGETNWSGFARAIFSESRAVGGPAAEVNDITTSDYPTPAQRPANSRLDCSRLMAVYGWKSPDWRDSIKRVVPRLVSAN